MRTKLVLILIVLSVLTGLSCSTSAETAPAPLEEVKGKAKVTYIANEGVLIEAGSKKVLIDGLHRKYLDEYAYPPDDLRAKLEKAEGEFSEIDLVLVSHIHGDHFHAESAGLHLLNNSSATLASSPQVIDSVREDFAKSDKIRDRLKEIPWENGKRHTYNDAIRISFLGTSHGTGRHGSIQNFGHIIEAGGLKFLHLGDAINSDENFDVFDIEKERIDVAFIPFWYLLSEKGRAVVDRQFNPKRIIAVHVDVNDADKIKKDLEAVDPRIRVFTRILETAEF